jgi:hypothetical protein
MVQAVSQQPLATEAQVHAWVCPCGICGGQSGTGTGSSPSSTVFPHQYHSTMVLHPHISSGEWTIGLLEVAVHRHSLTPSTWATRTSPCLTKIRNISAFRLSGLSVKNLILIFLSIWSRIATFIFTTVFCWILERHVRFMKTNSQEEWWQSGIWLSMKKCCGFFQRLQVWQWVTRLKLDFHWTN